MHDWLMNEWMSQMLQINECMDEWMNVKCWKLMNGGSKVLKQCLVELMDEC